MTYKYEVIIKDRMEDDRRWTQLTFNSLARARKSAIKHSLDKGIVETLVSDNGEITNDELLEYYAFGKLSIKVI